MLALNWTSLVEKLKSSLAVALWSNVEEEVECVISEMCEIGRLEQAGGWKEGYWREIMSG